VPAPAAAPSERAPVAEAPPPVKVIQGPVTPGPKFNDLVTAVLYQDPKSVEELLAFGKWPDKADSRGLTPLMLAVERGDAASTEALLKAGANPNRPGPGGETAASIARERNNAALLRLLQQHGGR
jgi:ankyrin repeat protein